MLVKIDESLHSNFSLAVNYFLAQNGFIRDDTILEKFLSAFSSLSLSRTRTLESYLRTVLSNKVETFTELPDDMQCFVTRILISLNEKLNSSWTMDLLSSLDFETQSIGCKTAMIEFYISVVASGEKFSPNIPFMEIVETFKVNNVYLRKKITCLVDAMVIKNHSMVAEMVDYAVNNLNTKDLNYFFVLLSVDFDKPFLKHAIDKLVTNHDTQIDPRLIVKHSEVSDIVSIDVYLSLDRRNPSFYYGLLVYSTQNGQHNSKILHCFKCAIDNGVNFKEYIVQPFLNFIAATKTDSSLDAELHTIFNQFLLRNNDTSLQIDHSTSLYIELMSKIAHRLSQKISNEVLVNYLYFSIDSCEPIVFQKAFEVLIDNCGAVLSAEAWSQKQILKKSPCSMMKSMSFASVSLKDCLEEGSKSVFWDVRDTVCSCINNILLRCDLSSEEDKNTIAFDLAQIISVLMNDSNSYVLCGVLKCLSTFESLNLLTCFDQSKVVNFFDYCSTFCDDAVHAEMLASISNSASCGRVGLERFASKDVYQRTFESDLCSYRTKSLAAKLLCIKDESSGETSLPDWLQDFLKSTCSDLALVEEIEIAIGRKERVVLSEEMLAEVEMKNICDEIIAESQAANVSLDCY